MTAKRFLLPLVLFASLCRASLVVVETPGAFVSPGAQISVGTSVIPFGSNMITNYNGVLSPNTEYFGRMGGTTFFRETDSPDVNSVIDATNVGFYQTQTDPVSTLYSGGAQVGTDNWVYITNLADENAWAQVEINAGTITPIKYVYDSTDRTAPITLSSAVNAIPEPGVVGLLAFAALVLAVRARSRRA